MKPRMFDGHDSSPIKTTISNLAQFDLVFDLETGLIPRIGVLLMGASTVALFLLLRSHFFCKVPGISWDGKVAGKGVVTKTCSCCNFMGFNKKYRLIQQLQHLMEPSSCCSL